MEELFLLQLQLLSGFSLEDVDMGNRPVTIERIKQQAIERGLECLSDVYDRKTKLKFRCSKGHEYETTFDSFGQGNGCPVCSKRAKPLIKDIKEFAQSFGYTVLSDEYVHCQEKLIVRCDKGHEYQVTWSNFKRGKRCPYCRGLYRTLEDIKNFVAENAKGYQCLNDAYVNGKTKLKIRCDKGHEYDVVWNSFQRGSRCPICANNQPRTIEYVKEMVPKLAEGYECLSDVYVNSNTNLLFRCDKGHEYTANWNHFFTGTRCPKCAGNQSYLISDIKTEVKKYGYECLSDEYNGAHTKLLFQCPEGHQYEATWNNFNNTGNRCPICMGRYRTLDEVIDYITNNAPGYICLNGVYENSSTPLVLRCDKGHIYKADWSHFVHGRRCPVCSGQTQPSILFVKKFAMKNKYWCMSDTYVNNSTKLKFRCPNGHIFETTWASFYNWGTRCRICMYKSRITRDEEFITDWKIYNRHTHRLSNLNYLVYYNQINPNGLKRSRYGYHLDHIYTIIDGFNNGILSEVIASPINLQMLPYSVNISKHGRSDMTKEELFQKYDEFLKEDAKWVK